MNDLVLAGKSLSEFGVIVSGGGAFNSAARSVSTSEVLGRSAEITIDNGYWSNVDLEYECGVVGSARMDAVRGYIASLSRQEFRIEDTYHPEEFYIGRVNGGITVKPSASCRVFNFTLNLRRRAERWLKSGEDALSGTSSQGITLFNPTFLPAYPVIRFEISENNLNLCHFYGSDGTGFYVTYPDGTEYGRTLVADCGEMTIKYEDDGTDYPSDYIHWDNDAQMYYGPGPIVVSTTRSAAYSVTPNWYTI